MTSYQLLHLYPEARREQITFDFDLGIITEGVDLNIHFRGEAHSFLCFAGMVEERGTEKCSETGLSLAAEDVLGNYW
jgi:hypothetical protein